jgi:hypothetical protein
MNGGKNRNGFELVLEKWEANRSLITIGGSTTPLRRYLGSP